MEMRFGRRALLRGLGAAVALPWLESVGGVAKASASVAAKPPVRMSYWYVPNGVHLPTWFPEREGALVDLPETLKPLTFAKDYLNCFHGLTHNRARINGDSDGCGHGQGAASYLTGAQAYRTQDNVYVGTSADQIYAQHVGNATRLSSLELGCEVARSGNAFGFSGTYKTHISWRNATSPVPYEINPKLVFDRLFTDRSSNLMQETLGDRDYYRRSILDYVMEDANRLSNKASAQDRVKLDQYMTGVREIERRIQSSGSAMNYKGVALEQPAGIPDDFDEHLRLMADLTVLAFQTDATRSSSFMVTKEATDRNYPWLGFTDGHHELSHHGNDAERNRKLREIDKYHISILAYMTEKMMQIEEEDGSTLLDNSMIMFGSGISDGDRHDHINLPVVLLGKGGGSLRTGQYLKFRDETPMANLLLAMLKQAGVNIDHFGDSTEPLPGLLTNA